MPIYNLPQDVGVNFSRGGEQMIIYIAGQVPILIPSILLALFMIIFVTGTQLQRKLEGKSIYPQWFAISGLITATVSILMLLIEGLISTYVVGITIGVSIIGIIWFFMSGD